MSDPLAPQDDAATELSPEEHEGLIPSYITKRAELNEAEQGNILEAREWAFSKKRDVLNEAFLKNLHKRMYSKVWIWAGEYRTTGKNIGIDAYLIPTDLRNLLDDVRYWIDHKTYATDEIGARLGERIESRRRTTHDPSARLAFFTRYNLAGRCRTDSRFSPVSSI